MFLKYLYLIILSLFMLGFIFNFAYSLYKDITTKKNIKKNPMHITGKIIETKQVKNRIYLLVEFTSDHNRLLFTETYELFDSDLKLEDYPVGKEVDLIYGDVSNLKKVRAFPLLMADLKVKLEKGPIFLNSCLVAMGAFILVQTILTFINKHAFTSDIPLITMNGVEGIYPNYLYILLMAVIYFIVVQYMVTNLIDTPRKDLQNYLKIYGNVAKARVKTYKFGRNKDSKGNKESLIELEFRTNEGVQVDTKLSSFLYTETQEEYIDIIYDPKNPKNIVYLKNN